MNLDLTRYDSNLEIKLDGRTLAFTFVHWDSEALGKPVYHLQNFSSGEHCLPKAKLIETYPDLARQLENHMLTARVPSSNLVLRNLLQGLGFHFVELTLHPQLSLLQSPQDYGIHLDMRLAEESQAELLLAEAETAFQHSRFFRDPLVPRGAASMRFREWVRSSWASDHKKTWIFFDTKGEPIAFFLDRAEGKDKFLELTAILGKHRGQGVAKLVWQTYLSHQRLQGVETINTNISAENSGVVALYPKLGFRFLEPSIAFHCHF